VNFAAWDAPAGDAATNAVQGASDVSALGTGTLRQGSRGEQVEALQRMLNEKMGGNLEVDGKFGKKTLQALQKYQESQGLDSDGVVGKDTRAALAGQGAAAAAGASAPGETSAGIGAIAPAGESAPADPATEGGAAPANPAAGPEAGPQTPPADQAGAEATPEAQAPEAAAEAGKTSGVPGTEDTSWTEKLPKGLKPHAEAFIEAGKKHGVDPRFLAAISMQETGGGTSYSMRKRNNAMGIMKGSKHRSFESVAASIDSQARSLSREGGLYAGKESISAIGNTYAPVGASNDPKNLNRHWIPNITKNFKSLGGDASGQVKGFDTGS
jgi:peptidoglycan hydrolase-like protein with peptidoglycan-binding domain